MVKKMKTDVNIDFFYKIKKNRSVKKKLNFFYFVKKEKSIEFRFYVFKYFPNFKRKIFIIEDKKWVKPNWSYGNYPKYHMPLFII